MEILIAIVLMGVAIIYFVMHPLKSLKWILIAITVLAVGTLAWFFLFAVLIQVSMPT